MVDIEKFICSLLNRASGLSVIKVIDIYDALNNQGLDYKDGKIIRVSPKLKESEGERIRKLLIKHLEQERGSLSNDEAAEAISWLEKQGEHSNFRNKIQVGDKVTINKDGVLVNLSQLNRVAKQGEQKSTDKVEPKFHEGDWVVSPNGVYWHVDAIRDGRYQVSSKSGECTDWSLDTNIYHKFTIQDAKDGDVLYCKSSGIEYIVMSKGVNEHGNIDSYFRYNSLDGFGVDVPSVLSSRQDNITPANKEQRDTLFAKMTDAGYKWDAENKQLRKIEQKSAWSEADEKQLNDIIGLLPELDIRHNWLKDLKERVGNFDDGYKVGFSAAKYNQWKPSDMQIGLLQAIVNEPNNAASESCQIALKEVIKQLKKLKGGDEHANE